MVTSSTARLMVQACQLYEKGFSQDDIAKMLTKSHNREQPYTQGYISKLLSKAESRGWLKLTIDYSVIPPELYSPKNTRAEKIASKYADCGLQKVFIHDIDFVSKKDDMTEVFDSLNKVLSHSRLVGTCCGRTIYRTLKAGKGKKHTIKRNMNFFPISSDIFGKTTDQNSATVMAQMAQTLLTHQQDAQTPTLRTLQSFISEKKEHYRKMQTVTPEYSLIFGANGYIENMDTLICSVSEYRKPFSANTDGFRKLLTGIGLEKLYSSEFVGEIAGAILLKNRPSKTTLRKVESIYNYYTNIAYADIEALSKRTIESKMSNGSGVVVIAGGKQKIETIELVLKRKLVNVLICDRVIAQAIE